jgi:hypothetical protein
VSEKPCNRGYVMLDMPVDHVYRAYISRKPMMACNTIYIFYGETNFHSFLCSFADAKIPMTNNNVIYGRNHKIPCVLYHFNPSVLYTYVCSHIRLLSFCVCEAYGSLPIWFRVGYSLASATLDALGSVWSFCFHTNYEFTHAQIRNLAVSSKEWVFFIAESCLLTLKPN